MSNNKLYLVFGPDETTLRAAYATISRSLDAGGFGNFDAGKRTDGVVTPPDHPSGWEALLKLSPAEAAKLNAMNGVTASLADD